ncbi:MAG TPA: ATP-binding protein [Pyrinomonadaceae bacterium]|nr:ATP-binding protein [Pyrinomonadaceae bacterium]
MAKLDTLSPRTRSAVYRYGFALALVVAALLVTRLFEAYFERAPAALFFCAVTLSSWFAGTGPGLLATLTSGAAINSNFLHPLVLGSAELPRQVLLLFSCVVISWMGGSQRRTKESLRQARDDLEAKVQERTAELRQSNRELQAEIAERKEAEQALRSSEARLKQAQAVAHLGSYDVDVLTGQTRWSDEVFRILGLDPASGSLSRQDFVERIIHPEDRDYAIQRYDQAAREGKLYDLECRVVRPDGSVRFVQSMGEPITSADGIVVRLVGVLLDITERKQIEDNLARLNRTLRTLYQCDQALVHASDEYELLQAVCGILVGVGGLRMTWVGYRELDAEKTVRPVARAGFDHGYVESIKALWADNQRGQGPTGTAIRTGKSAWTKSIQTDSSVAPWRAEALKRGYGSNLSLPLMHDGAAFGALTLYARESNAFNERTSEQYAELANNLAYGVMALRTREERQHAEDALHEAQAELAHVTRVMAMGELTASIAHEINQPLAAVIANANACFRWLANSTPNLDEARDAISRIVRDGNRASDVIGRIRALVKKGSPEKTLLDINESVQEVVSLIQGEIQKKSVILRLELTAGLPRVLSDRVGLQQVILNLVMNGIEAMNSVTDRPRSMVIRSCQHEPDQVLVAVQDSGIGIDPQNIAKVFDTFYTTKPQGMGMGLAISRSIIEAHGGRLWAVANEGPGATFQFTLAADANEATALFE